MVDNGLRVFTHSALSRQLLGEFNLPGYDFTTPFEIVGVTKD